jgi:eukaryotic-like serine/threonine-protein kinase
MTLESNSKAGLKMIVDFIDREVKETLDEREQAIIIGCLDGLTYQEIKQRSAILRGVTVEFISRFLAWRLWKKLNDILDRSAIASKQIKVSKNRLWYLVEEIANLEIISNELEINSFPGILLEGKILRERYEITEYLYDRNLTERHFLAVDRDLGNKTCLAVQLVSGDRSVQNRFNREAAILASLSKHQQIPELLAYFEEDRYFYLVYEYIEGEPLTNKVITGTPWQENQIKFFLQDILPVLHFIHQHGVIHRNINPDSLIQRSDNKISLIDFATVKKIDNNSSISANTFSEGVRGYVSSEQLMGIPTLTSDIYAVGKIAIHAATGIHPCQLKINRNTGNTIWRNYSQVRDRLADIIDKMAYNYFPQRYQSATEVLKDLDLN